MDDYPVLQQQDIVITEYEDRDKKPKIWPKKFSFLGAYIAEKREENKGTGEHAFSLMRLLFPFS